MQLNTVKFPKPERGDFFTTLNQRVNQYFTQNNISRFANASMVVKTIAMFAIYIVPYFLLVTATVTHPLAVIALWAMLGLGMAGIGFSVMHDANHGSYSRKTWANKMLGSSLNFLGGSMTTWKIQHNVLHHSFTNVDGFDEDIDIHGLLRFSPNQPLYKYHRFQHLYAWGLYALMTFPWVTTKDFRQIMNWKKEGLIESQGRTYLGAWIEIIVTKIFYYAYILVLPLIFSPVSWWVTVLGFLLLHLVAGFVLAIIFQPAHVVPTSTYPLPDESGQIDHTWAVHQLHTTCNFAPRNTILSWFTGGLNFQIEHHLFPNICHVHYKKISRIVRETAQEFGLPYHERPTFRSALRFHGKQLYELGRMQPVYELEKSPVFSRKG
jgi:linoleoyl-CoA desaturase